MTSTTKPNIELSFSSINQIIYCPRKYQIRKRFIHPESQWDNSLAAAGGSAIHEYLQNRAIGRTHEEASLAFFKAYSFDAENLETSEQNIFYRGFEACYNTAIEMSKQINIKPEEVAVINVNGDDRHAIELKFCLKFVNKDLKFDYSYRGAIDLVKYAQFNNRFSATDFKTHRDKGGALETFSRQHVYKHGFQLVPYGLIVAFMQKSGSVNGIVTNDILNSVPEFMVEYYDIWIDTIEPILRPYKFKKGKSEVKEWLDRLTMQIMHIEFYGDNDVWPRQHSSTGCAAFAKRCTYYKHCHIEDRPSLQHALLDDREPKIEKPFGEWINITVEI